MADLDLLLVADPRLPGAEARALGLLVDRLVGRGWTIGLLPIRSPLPLAFRLFARALAKRIDSGDLILVDSDCEIGSRLLLAWHVGPLCGPLDRPPRLRTGHAVLRFEQVPWPEGSIDHASLARIRGHFAEMAAGAGTEEVAADAGIARLLGLPEDAWLPPAVVEAPSWRGSGGGSTTIGRHGGVGNAAWPGDPLAFARAYPAQAGLQVDLLDAPLSVLRQRISTPSRWLRLLPQEHEPLPSFLARLDAWHLATWLGRPQPVSAELVEAAAAGAPLSLPREVAGWPDGAASVHSGEFRELMAEPAAGVRRALDFLRASADPARLADRLAARRMMPARSGPGPSADAGLAAVPRSTRTALMVSPNGVGMGHLTRLLAVARRLPANVEPIFLTMSQAVGVIGDYGFHGEYVPYHSYYGGDADCWNRGLLARLQAMVGFFDPGVILFDGNMPYAALADLRGLCQERRFVWLRRGLWRPDAGKAAIDRSSIFDMIIEPGEFAAEADRGLTRTRGGEVIRVPPVTLLDPDEILDRAAARTELDIPPDSVAVVIMLGSQNNFDYGQIRRTIMTRLGGRPHIVLVEAEWLISENKSTTALEGVRKLSGYPLARLFRAFDFAISATGYNSFHELLSIGIPTIFVPNENPSMDEQEARAAWAERSGLGVMVRTHQLDRLSWALDALQGPGVGPRMAASAARLPATDGGSAIARLIGEQVVARDVVARPRGHAHLAPHAAPLLS